MPDGWFIHCPFDYGASALIHNHGSVGDSSSNKPSSQEEARGIAQSVQNKSTMVVTASEGTPLMVLPAPALLFVAWVKLGWQGSGVVQPTHGSSIAGIRFIHLPPGFGYVDFRSGLAQLAGERLKFPSLLFLCNGGTGIYMLSLNHQYLLTPTCDGVTINLRQHK